MEKFNSNLFVIYKKIKFRNNTIVQNFNSTRIIPVELNSETRIISIERNSFGKVICIELKKITFTELSIQW
jgi:hypothetical protein